jgi:uncharacterized protein (UPF0335 family)
MRRCFAQISGQRSCPTAVTSRLRELIQQLGEAIHESVIESEQIAGVVQDIRQHGFDVLLMLEATIGLNEVAAKDSEDEAETADNDVLISAVEGVKARRLLKTTCHLPALAAHLCRPGPGARTAHQRTWQSA